MRRLAVSLVLAGLLATGCSQAGDSAGPSVSPSAVASSPSPAESAPPSASFTPPSPPSTPEPSETAPAEMTIEQAGEYYLDWICWSNKSSDHFFAVVKDRTYQSLASKKYRDAAKRAAKVARDTALALDSPPIPWPSNVAGPAGKVAQQLLSDVSALNRWATAENSSDVERAWAAYSRGSNTAAQTVRLRLGLPSASSKKDGCAGRGDRPVVEAAAA